MHVHRLWRAKAPAACVWLEATLPAGGKPHLVVPFLGAGTSAPAHLQYNVTVYSELPLAKAANHYCELEMVFINLSGKF